MTPSPNATDAAVIGAFAKIPALLDRAPALVLRGRTLDCECLLGPMGHPFHVSIEGGRIIDLTPAPVLMRSWRFSYRASSIAWAEYWKPAPRPGLTGEYDFSCTPEDTKRTAAAIVGASVTIMEHLGHFPMSENPEQFRRYIAPVLGQILKQSIPSKQGEHV